MKKFALAFTKFILLYILVVFGSGLVGRGVGEIFKHQLEEVVRLYYQSEFYYVHLDASLDQILEQDPSIVIGSTAPFTENFVNSVKKHQRLKSQGLPVYEKPDTVFHDILESFKQADFNIPNALPGERYHQVGRSVWLDPVGLDHISPSEPPHWWTIIGAVFGLLTYPICFGCWLLFKHLWKS